MSEYVLVKYKDVKLLINQGLDVQPLIENLSEIENLACKVNHFYLNLLSATTEQGNELDLERQQLISKIGYNVIGVPFTNHEAELYALSETLDFQTLELT